MTPRVWAERDRVAVRDRVDQPWQLGTVHRVHASGYIEIRPDEPGASDIRHPNDSRVVPVEQVPVDEALDRVRRLVAVDWAIELHQAERDHERDTAATLRACSGEVLAALYAFPAPTPTSRTTAAETFEPA